MKSHKIWALLLQVRNADNLDKGNSDNQNKNELNAYDLIYDEVPNTRNYKNIEIDIVLSQILQSEFQWQYKPG